MSFSYNENRIVASGVYYIDVVRFLVNDTDSTNYDVSDELISALYNSTSTLVSQILRNYQTALATQEYICNKRASNIQSFSSGGTSVTYTQNNCNDKISHLRQLVMLYSGAGGVLYPSRCSGFTGGDDYATDKY